VSTKTTVPALNPPSFRFPHNITGLVHPAVERAIRDTYSGLIDNMQAWTSLKPMLDSLTTQTAAATAAASTSTNTIETVLSTQFPGLGTVNDQTGRTAYTTQTGDNGAVILFDDASAVAVTLNSTVAKPYFFFVTNLGTGTATLTPTSGLINGSASYALLPNDTAIITFESPDWVAAGVAPGPSNTPAVTHEWLNSYNSTTLAFTQTQPAFADISGTAAAGQVPALSALSGQITTSQLPASGITATITTAALTIAGTQGSMTFQNGILTAQTPAT
jgi:hypothetical protein